MFNSRRAYTDPDINLDLIRSKILREIITQHDAYCPKKGDQQEITLVDGYQRYFLRMLDIGAEYKLDIMDYMEEEFDFDSPLQTRYRENNHSIFLPTLRLVYVVPHHRGKGIQRQVLNELKAIADEVGESFALFTDPLILSGRGRETNAVECMAKFDQNGHEPPEDYMYQLWKQRKRMLDTGLTNVKYTDAQVTEPCQSFVYINKQASPQERGLFNELKREYLFRSYDLPEQSD